MGVSSPEIQPSMEGRHGDFLARFFGAILWQF
jgi:hypothetical protein